MQCSKCVQARVGGWINTFWVDVYCMHIKLWLSEATTHFMVIIDCIVHNGIMYDI